MAEHYGATEKVHITSSTDKLFIAQTQAHSEAGGRPQSTEAELDWKVGKEEWAIVIVLAIVSLMVALDATILVTALPVGIQSHLA